VRAAALVFPNPAGTESRLAVLAACDAAELTFSSEDNAAAYRTDFTILARIRTADGEVVRKASQPYRLSGPAADLARARQGEVLFFRQPTLAPGTYTLEIAVHDALARRAGVRTSTFEVPETKPQALQVSSLVIVRRAERVTEGERDANNPLYVDTVLIYPNLGEPIHRAQEPAITILATILPAGSDAPRAMLEVWRADQRLTVLPLQLASTDATSRIQQLARISTAALTPGDYTLRLILTQGDQREQRDARISVQP